MRAEVPRPPQVVQGLFEKRFSPAPAAPVEDFTTPQDLDSERWVLGYVFARPDIAAETMQDLSSDLFFKPENEWTYQAMHGVLAKNETVTLAAVRDELTKHNRIDDVGLPRFRGRERT